MSIEFREKHDGQWLLSSSSTVEPFVFNGGERHLRGSGPVAGTRYLTIVRGADANDYVTAALWGSWCRNVGAPLSIFAPYLPAARSDRGLPTACITYARLLSLIPGEQLVVHTLDPHSKVMPPMVRGCNVLAVASIIANATRNLRVSCVIAPDEGAVGRASAVASELGVLLVCATKKRDFASGALSSFECPALPAAGTVLVVDDICDNGGTFVGLAQATGLPLDRLALWVTHGAFGPRAPQLHNHYFWVGCTDSHPNSNQLGGHRVSIANWFDEIS